MRDITPRPILYIPEPYSPWENSTTQQNIQVDTCKSPETRCPDGLGARSGGDAYDRNQNHTRTHRNA